MVKIIFFGFVLFIVLSVLLGPSAEERKAEETVLKTEKDNSIGSIYNENIKHDVAEYISTDTFISEICKKEPLTFDHVEYESRGDTYDYWAFYRDKSSRVIVFSGCISHIGLVHSGHICSVHYNRHMGDGGWCTK